MTRGSALLGLAVMPALSSCSSDKDGDTATSTSSPPVRPGTPSAEGGDGGAATDIAIDVTVDFDGAAPAARIDSRFAGLSYEKNELTEPLFRPDNQPLIALFRLLGPAVLRIGANQVDRSSWRGEIDGMTSIWRGQVDGFAEFVRATDWEVIYGINMAENTPENAADEAGHAEAMLGSALRVWEIGNEPDLYRRLGYRDDEWGYRDYLREWRGQRDAIDDVTPGVPFCGPSTTFDLSRIALPFAAAEGGERTPMLSQHYYRADGDGPEATMDTLLRPDPELQAELDLLVATAAWADMPQGLRLNECNSFFNAGAPGVSNAFGTALWTIDFMFTCAMSGCTGVNLHGGGSGPGYTPIADLEGRVIEARPVFYGMLLFTQACPGVPVAGIRAAFGERDVDGIGAWRIERDTNIVLVNKDGKRELGMDVQVEQARFEPLWLRGGGLMATAGHTLGGVAIEPDGSWDPVSEPLLVSERGRLPVLLPPACAVLLRSR